MNFEIHKPNIQQMEQYLRESQENQNRNNNSRDSIRWWNFPEGMSVIRVLPPWDPTGRIALPVYSHRIQFRGKNMKFDKFNWTCVNATFGKQCVICDALAEMQAAGVNVDNWSPYSNSRKFYFNAIVMHDPVYHAMVVQQGKNPEEVPGVAPGTHVLVRSPKTVYDWIVAQITNPLIGDITDIQNGIDIYVTKEGSGLSTKYNCTLSPNGRTPVPKEYLDKIEKLYNPDEIFSQAAEPEVLQELVEHLKRSAGLLTGGIPATHGIMAGPMAPGATPNSVPPGGFGTGGFGSGTVNVSPQASAPSVPPPPEPPVQEHVDAAGNKYQLINNQWVLVEPATPPAPPTSSAPQSAPTSPSAAPEPPVTPQPQVAPQAPQVPTAPPAGAPPTAPADARDSGRPKCFGQHNPADVKCVVCPYELDCSSSKGM